MGIPAVLKVWTSRVQCRVHGSVAKWQKGCQGRRLVRDFWSLSSEANSRVVYSPFTSLPISCRFYTADPLSSSVPISSEERLRNILTKSEALAQDASALADAQEFAKAESLLEGALALRSRAFKEIEKTTVINLEDFNFAQAKLKASLAYSKQALCKFADAEELYKEALPVFELVVPDTRDLGALLLNYAELMYSLKRYEEAIKHCERSCSILRKFHLDDEIYAAAISNYSGYLCLVKRFSEAKPYSAQALKIFVKKLGKRNDYTKNAWSNYYCILKELGLDEEAKDLETDWHTPDVAPMSEKMTEKQLAALRKKVEQRLYAHKRADVTGHIKDSEFYQKELNTFFEQWRERGLDLEDPAHAKVIEKELDALRRGKQEAERAFRSETQSMVETVNNFGTDWEELVKELSSVENLAKEIDEEVHKERMRTHEETLKKQAGSGGENEGSDSKAEKL
ncbi:uncharacterized protein LOC126316819 [Schistocerca gregaria]|uniref:uncharacterized protein LOC126316819 n=1 Tax=Schistocerca gregaria TaxID=7010 RepID=UPI00211E3763|nr:uncharacterized protein LOC126316819 [Schistocerca gregaria]